MNFFRTFSMSTCMILALLVLGSCRTKENPSKEDATKKSTELVETYTEKFRPQFHFSPQEKWMNDPNGLVFHQGVYHLFYQYYPDDIVWGPMHWGHAVSKDLVHWEHKPIALYPDKHGLIFSGSAVVDSENTSGFGSKENPPLVAIFTYHLMEGEKAGRTDFQTQGIAYSLDNGDSWTKYEGNPVIGNNGIKDFRDPKVFWHKESKQWIMILVAGDHAKFYSSPNLKDWTYLSDFGKDQGAHGGVWECPDLFKLKVEGTDEEKWMLIISINPGAPNGGSGTQYFVGDFDGTEFKSAQQDIKWIDYGTDNYAGVTYNNVPSGERIFIGWMSNWNYARNTPTEVWRSAMTIPRSLTLTKEIEQYFLKSKPWQGINRLAQRVQSEKPLRFEGQINYRYLNKSLQQNLISFSAKSSKALDLLLTNQTGDSLRIAIDPVKEQVFLDRSKTGYVDFEAGFSNIQSMPFKPTEKINSYEIYLDHSSVELFIDEGRYVMTGQLFPKEPLTYLSISAEEGQEIQDFKIQSLKSIWNEK